MSQTFRSLGWFVAVWFASFLNVIASNSLACIQDEPPGLTVQELSAIPNSVGVAGPFVGVIDNQLIVAGGANFPDAPPWEGGTKVWHDSAYVLNKLNGQWQNAGQLPRALGYGVSVSLPQGMLCIGGSDLGRHYPDVFLCRLQEKQLVSQNCQALPIPLANACGGRVGDWVLVAAGSEEPGERSASARVFGLFVGSSDAQPLPQRSWVEFPALPSSGRILPGAAAFKDQLYVFGGAAIEFTEGRWQRRYLQDAWCLTVDRQPPIRSQWKQVRDLPNFVVASPSPSPILGPNHFLVLGGDDGSRVGFQPVSEQPGFNPQAWLYHRVTDTWTPAGNLPIARVTTGVVAWKDGWAVPTGEIRPGVRTPLVHHLKWPARTPSFGWLNYTVLIAYLVVILAVGTGMAGLARTTDQFYRAGQSIPWWAASLSIFATMLSSITFMSIPAQGYSVGWNLFLGSVYVVLTPLIVYVYLPFFRRLNVTSAYEYLERRFNVAVRLLASSQFILFQLGRIAVVLLLPSLALATVAGTDIVGSIIVVGVLCLGYTLFGGMRAVIWTDAAQAVTLILGASGAVYFLLGEIPGGSATVWETVDIRGRFFHSVPWSWDLTLATGWFIMLGSLFTNLFAYTASQDVVQRYVTTKDERAAARAIWGNAFLSPLAQAIFFAIGSCLLAYYVQFPERLDVNLDNDAVFPQFIVRQMPAGLAGLIIAAILAASQSTISSSLNSLATAYTVDFHQRLRGQMLDADQLKVARRATLVGGLLGIVIATYLATSGMPRSLWESFLTVIGLFSGAISGLFVLGIFTRSANGGGALIGGMCSVALVMLVYWNQWTTFWLYSVIGVVSCVVVGYLASFLFPRVPTDPRLTVFGLRARGEVAP